MGKAGGRIFSDTLSGGKSVLQPFIKKFCESNGMGWEADPLNHGVLIITPNIPQYRLQSNSLPTSTVGKISTEQNHSLIQQTPKGRGRGRGMPKVVGHRGLQHQNKHPVARGRGRAKPVTPMSSNTNVFSTADAFRNQPLPREENPQGDLTLPDCSK